MSVIKAAPVQGTFSGFVPRRKVQEPARPQPTPKVAKQKSLSELLSELNTAEQRQLLQKHFAEEFSQLEQEARQQGYEQAKQEAEGYFVEQFQQQQDKLNEQISLWHELVASLKDTTSWKLEDEETATLLMCQAMDELLGTSLDNKELVHQQITQAIKDYGQKGLHTMFLAPLQYEQYLLLKEQLPELEIAIKPDFELKPGSYRLALANGSVQHDLLEAHAAFYQAIQKRFSQKEG